MAVNRFHSWGEGGSTCNSEDKTPMWDYLNESFRVVLFVWNSLFSSSLKQKFVHSAKFAGAFTPFIASLAENFTKLSSFGYLCSKMDNLQPFALKPICDLKFGSFDTSNSNTDVAHSQKVIRRNVKFSVSTYRIIRVVVYFT